MKETGLMFKAPLVRSILDGSKTQTRRILKLRPGFDFEECDDGRLWPWAEHPDRGDDVWMPCPYGGPGDRIYVRETFAHGIHAMAAAREEDGPFVYAADGTTEGRLGNKWTPCLLMPKYAARIWLDVTGVRVERLQDITDADALAEGVDRTNTSIPGYARERFRQLWESTGGDWAANPWVWVIDFKRDLAPKAQP